MRVMLRRLPGDMPLVYRTLPIYVAGYWTTQWCYAVFWVSPAPSWSPATEGTLLAVLLAALAAWSFGHVRGAWTDGTGAGFPLAALGMAGRLWADFLVQLSTVPDASFYDAHPGSASQLVWIHRNVGLAAFAYGLTLVAGSCFLERRLRRGAPDWVFSPWPFADVRARGRPRARAAPRHRPRRPADGPR